MTSTIPLFRFTQIRDLNGPDSVSLRARHVPLFHGFEIEYPLAEFHDASRYLNIEKIKAYLRTESFIARASIVQDLYMMSSGRFVGTFNPEYDPILPALRIAYGVAQCFRDRSEVSRLDLENLVSTWGDIGPLSGVPSEIFTLTALKDLSALYVTPMNYMDYRRLLAALRRVSYVSEQFEPSVIQTQLTELLDEEDTPIGGAIDLLFGSRILISPQAFQVERQAIGKEEDPSRPSPGFQTGPIAEVLAGSTHVTQLVPAIPAKLPKKKTPANAKTRKPKKALKITPAKKTRPSPVKIKSVKG